MSLDDPRAQFISMLGACMDSARLGGITVRVELEDGTLIAGVPAEPATVPEGDEIDATGTRSAFMIGGEAVDVMRVARYEVFRPD